MTGIKFELTYSAMKMFGKQLYSNVGSALSELVANGLDARASNVYLTINLLDKEHSFVEVYDDGKGMSPEEIAAHYIKIGYNKRKNEFGLDDGKTMGRKGIGKLAALYLSDCFSIITKKEDSSMSCWSLDVSNLEDDSTPELFQSSYVEFSALESYNKLIKNGHGTIIYLKNVNLRGLGERAFDSLAYRLSNLFLYDKLEQRIWLKIISDSTSNNDFLPIKKQIAFRNFAYVYTTDMEYVKECINNTFLVPYKTKTGVEKRMRTSTEVIDFANTDFKITGEETFFGIQKRYKLDGWIAIHATIDGKDATINDSRYVKNQFYSPNQLRVYVRNKLAMANIIEYLGITRAFVNYIEGEVSFDILDDDDLEDIATAGRQDFDTQDPRFLLLKNLLAKICNSLVAHRQALADKVRERKREEDISISSKSKNLFQKEFHGMLCSMRNIEPQDRDTIEHYAVAQLEGNVNIEPKSEFTVFISHAGKDHIFSDFIYHLLVNLGFNGNPKDPNREIFYSSSGLDTDDLTPLSLLIKQYIIRKNNDILFLTSPNFGNSEYCLFEGGAAWATKSVGDYKILALTYESIPKFLTNGKSEIVLNARSKEDLYLNEKNYNYILEIINRIISHLNKNREIAGLDLVPCYKKATIPDKVHLRDLGKTETDFMDSTILKYWKIYVLEEAEKYFQESTYTDLL